MMLSRITCAQKGRINMGSRSRKGGEICSEEEGRLLGKIPQRRWHGIVFVSDEENFDGGRVEYRAQHGNRNE